MTLARLSFGALAAGAAAVLALPGRVLADDALLPSLPFIGVPAPGGTSLQRPVTALAREVVFLDTLLMWIITIITLFVVGLLAWVIYFHNRKSNPEPARFSHNTPLEIAWTVVPALILVFIAVFTFPALRHQQIMPEADVTIKVTGFQWYWGYEYVDHGVTFEAFMLRKDELADHGFQPSHYLLATDRAMVVPVGRNIVLQVTSADVIHAWAVPAFGVKQDGVPGRLAELWFNAQQEGVFFGQCSELCGINHAYMPITVKVVSEAEYVAWLERLGADFAVNPPLPGWTDATRLAAAP